MFIPVKKNKDSLKDNANIFYQIRNLYRENDSLYRNHISWLKNNKELVIDSMVSRTIKFLPKKKLITDSLPQIYYHALDHDGSANSKGIFISIMAAYDNNIRRLANFEAHEFHHIQRPSLIKGVKINKADEGLLWALNSVLNEGLADLVDKDVMLAKESDWWLKDMVNDLYIGKSGDVIANFDILITNESLGIHNKEEKYREAFLNSVGHIPGFWMAKVIQDNGEATEMIKNADNPFLFLFIYNQIASKYPNKYKAFSNSSIEYLKKLQHKYALD